MRTWWRTQLPFFACLLCFAAVPLLLGCFLSFYRDSLDPVFVCDADNCVVDNRSWADRNTVLLGCTVATVVAAVGSLVALRLRRRP